MTLLPAFRFGAILLALAASATTRAGAVTSAGTVLSNTVSATYADGAGAAFSTTSNTISVTVSAVGSLAVGPKEQGCSASTDGFVMGQTFVRTYTITNTSNIPDSYTITNATTSAGTIQGIAFAGGVPVTTGSTVSPVLQPGGTIQVQVTVGNTAGVAVGTDISVTLTARSTTTGTANGLQSDTGVQCAIALQGATLSSPAGPGLLIQKLVNGTKSIAANGGATITYSISFEDFGGAVAQNVVVTDPIPVGLAVSAASVKVNGLTTGFTAVISGQTLSVTMGNVVPNTPEVLTFTATVLAQATTGQVYVNTASVAADNVAATRTSPATVIVGTANVVYDGYAGASTPVGGAVVQLVDPKTGLPIALSGAGAAPNTTNVDPFITGADGTYSFGLGGQQISGTYDIIITAPGYLNRKIQVTLTPDPTGTLYTVTLTALDGQPLANAGGFTITGGPVTLSNIFGFFGNLPLFAAHPVTISKSSDRSFAAGGDRIVFTLTYADATVNALGATAVIDTLPPGLVYAPGTGRVDGVPVEPAVTGRVITWNFPSLMGSHTIVYAAVILPGTAAGASLENDVTISAGIPAEPGHFATASANAIVDVTGGVFDARTVITGRVYLDVARTGHVTRSDVWLAGVRVYLEDGESAVTDSSGRYSFPGVRPGMHVLRLDPTTYPLGVTEYDDHSIDSERSARRLVHHLSDSGLIEDINFALTGSVQR